MHRTGEPLHRQLSLARVLPLSDSPDRRLCDRLALPALGRADPLDRRSIGHRFTPCFCRFDLAARPTSRTGSLPADRGGHSVGI